MLLCFGRRIRAAERMSDWIDAFVRAQKPLREMLASVVCAYSCGRSARTALEGVCGSLAYVSVGVRARAQACTQVSWPKHKLVYGRVASRVSALNQ